MMEGLSVSSMMGSVVYYQISCALYIKFGMRELTHEVTHEHSKQYTVTLGHTYLGALRHHTYTKKPREG